MAIFIPGITANSKLKNGHISGWDRDGIGMGSNWDPIGIGMG